MSLSFAIIREGKVGLGGSTGAMLARSMEGLRTLVDRSVAEFRLETGGLKLEAISLLQFMEEMQVSGAVHADGYGVQLTVHPVDRELMVDGDWQLLSSAVSNLLQNAFKFSRAHGHVSLGTCLRADRVSIDIGDECGGLPQGKAEQLFRSLTQNGASVRVSVSGLPARGTRPRDRWRDPRARYPRHRLRLHRRLADTPGGARVRSLIGARTTRGDLQRGIGAS